jgi:hypothetical protein
VVERASCEQIATGDDSGASNRAERYGLYVAWFEADCGARRNVKALSIRAAPIKREGSIGLDEVVM